MEITWVNLTLKMRGEIDREREAELIAAIQNLFDEDDDFLDVNLDATELDWEPEGNELGLDSEDDGS